MSCKLLLAICAVVVCLAVTIEAVPLRSDAVVHKLDYEGVQANERGSRQAYEEDASNEDSDEDDDEDDAEQLQQNIIQQQQAQEQAVNDSQEGSDEDDEEDEEEDDDDDEDDDGPSFLGRRRRDVTETEANNAIEEIAKPVGEHEEVITENTSDNDSVIPDAAAPTSPPNTNVLILIRDAIKKVTTELPNSQQVATSAQQYFQLFEHFIQETIEQVIGDDEEDDEVESTTILAESETAFPVELEGDKETSSSSPSDDKETETTENKPETAEVALAEQQTEKTVIEEAKA